MKAYVIGCGGGGSILAPILCKLIGRQRVTLVDGDKLEKRNLDRQLFEPQDVGRHKAEALARRLDCSCLSEFYHHGLIEHERADWLLVCVDNHPARLEVLKACDFSKCSAVFAANEVLSSEAYCYRPRWKDTPMDPRVMYPEILTDRRGDPRAAAIGCTGEAQERTRQLVTANLMSASLALHLFVVWALEAQKLNAATLDYLPHKLVCNMTSLETFKPQTTNERTSHE